MNFSTEPNVAANNTFGTPSPDASTPVVASLGMVARDRRQNSNDPEGRSAISERRQFGSSHIGLSEQGRELATAIDAYKLSHHRRYITCDEMLVVLRSLGYAKS